MNYPKFDSTLQAAAKKLGLPWPPASTIAMPMLTLPKPSKPTFHVIGQTCSLSDVLLDDSPLPAEVANDTTNAMLAKLSAAHERDVLDAMAAEPLGVFTGSGNGSQPTLAAAYDTLLGFPVTIGAVPVRAIGPLDKGAYEVAWFKTMLQHLITFDGQETRKSSPRFSIFTCQKGRRSPM